MRYTKDDVLKLKALVKEINDLLAEKFACNHIMVSTIDQGYNRNCCWCIWKTLTIH